MVRGRNFSADKNRPYLDVVTSVFDDFGTVGKLRVSAFQRCQNHRKRRSPRRVMDDSCWQLGRILRIPNSGFSENKNKFGLLMAYMFVCLIFRKYISPDLCIVSYHHKRSKTYCIFWKQDIQQAKRSKVQKISQNRTFTRTKSFKVMKILKFLKAGHLARQKIPKQDKRS